MALSVIPNTAESLLLVGASSSQHKAKGEERRSGNVGSWQLTIFNREKTFLPLITRLTDPGPLAILILNTHYRMTKQELGVVKTGL